jgi:hypothetical protein
MALQVGAAAVLACAAAVLAISITETRYVRYDLTRSKRNTVDAAIADILAGAPDDVEFDLFYRDLAPPFDRVTADAQQLMRDLLLRAVQSDRGRVRYTLHDVRDLSASRARQQELGVQGSNLIVVSCGERRAVLHLFRDVVRVAWGNPTRDQLRYLVEQGVQDPVDERSWNPDPGAFRPASIAEFVGDEALAVALLRVTAGEAPLVLFTTGHGEGSSEAQEASPLHYGLLRAGLELEGYRTGTYDPAAGEPPPDDAAVLVMLGPDQPLRPEELERLRAFVRGGGRLLAAPAVEELVRPGGGGVSDLLREYGMDLVPGIVCRSISSPSGSLVDGHPACADVLVDSTGFSASHPVTEPLRRAGRRVRVVQGATFDRGQPPAGALLHTLLSTPRDVWRDLPANDFRFDRGAEQRGRFALVMALEFGAGAGDGAGARSGQVLGIAAAHLASNDLFPYNRDLFVAAIDHLAERDHRVRLTRPDPRLSFLDVSRGSARGVLTWTLLFGLPGLLLLAGAVVTWRRRVA